VAIIALMVTGNNKTNRRFDNRITLRKSDKIPYGMFVAYHNLKYLFPEASISANKYEPGYWDSLSNYSQDQVLIIMTDHFNADDYELEKLVTFVEKGNDVFVSARVFSSEAKKMFRCETSGYGYYNYYGDELGYNDSLTVSLTGPPFQKNTAYVYPGRKMNSSFKEVDTAITDVLGNDEDGNPNFIHLQAGKGNFYLHLAPIAFSNYFLLHKNNLGYFEQAFSLIDRDVKRIVWDEYYLYKNADGNNDGKKGWMSVLFRYPGFKAALITAILALLLFVLLEMRRKQRIIPVINKPKNDSLDFVKTIGRLYFDKSNHLNLCKKMAAFFLEHARNKYKLPTGELGEEFIKNLQYKSGASEIEVREIIAYIKYLDDAPGIAPAQLNAFHKQLESFYQKT
jgi:hypothetical protein